MGNIANEHPTLTFPFLTYKRLKSKRMVCFGMTWRLLCCHLFPKLPENVTATHIPQTASNTHFTLDNLNRHEGHIQ
jgi:hypothetical protein